MGLLRLNPRDDHSSPCQGLYDLQGIVSGLATARVDDLKLIQEMREEGRAMRHTANAMVASIILALLTIFANFFIGRVNAANVARDAAAIVLQQTTETNNVRSMR